MNKTTRTPVIVNEAVILSRAAHSHDQAVRKPAAKHHSQAARKLAAKYQGQGACKPAAKQHGQAVMLRPAPEDTMASYIARRRRRMTILVCEHKQTFCAVRSLMHDEGQRTFFGIRIDGVVYGQQGAFTHAGVLPAFERHACMHSRRGLARLARKPKVRYLYWGDVDSLSVDQIMKMYRANPGSLISPFMPAYRCMLDRALGRKLKKTNNEPASAFSIRIAKHLDPRRRSTYENVLANGLCIPQLVIDKQILRARKAG